MGHGNNILYPYGYPQIGLMIYELLDMKSTLEYKYVVNQDNSLAGYHDFNFVQSIYLAKKYNIGITYNHKQSSNLGLDMLTASFNYYF